MKVLVVLIALLGATFAFAGSARKQYIQCKGVDSKYQVAVFLDVSNDKVGKKDLLFMTLVEPKTATKKSTIDLNPLYVSLYANHMEVNSLRQADTVSIGGTNDDVGTRFDAYHLDIPARVWGQDGLKFTTKGWFQDCDVGGGITYEFVCRSSIRVFGAR